MKAKCDTCGYTGTKGMWKGHYMIGDKKIAFKGKVTYDNYDGDTWDITPILPEEVDSFDGMCYCPKCDSINFD